VYPVLCLSGLGRWKGSVVVVGVTAPEFVDRAERKMLGFSEQMPDLALGNPGRPSSNAQRSVFG
jgi:hypothetical protein